ncbi:MAG: bifunctional 2-polyprenyl-6-hydroxyphenol methylase/3-demethylubiquinol 3-O-methyltransferase UbiG [Polyangiaceae bacterium]
MGNVRPPLVNNDIYHSLGERWYRASDDPIALLRAESRLRNPWIAGTLARAEQGRACRVLDVGCGGGFLSNSLAAAGHEVTGVDASQDALNVAALHDSSGSVRYRMGNALQLPYDAGSFDAVCAMDFLEHVEEPRQVIAEAARVLKPSGLFFFHTFNRNFMAWLIVIKGVEWFVKNTPKDLHLLRLFLKPAEVRAACAEHGLGELELRGVRPQFGLAFWRMLMTGSVPDEFGFKFTKSTRLGYSGVARKR